MRKLSLVSMMLAMVLMVGCTIGSYRLQRGEIRFGDGYAVGAYTAFDGYKEQVIRLHAGDRLEIASSVASVSGNLRFSLLDTDRQTMRDLTTDAATSVMITTDGRYRIRVEADEHQGGFSLYWTVE